MDTDGAFARLAELGVFDPSAGDAESRRALIEYLLELGATIDDLVDFRDELPVVASMIVTRPPGPRLTLREVAQRTGTDLDLTLQLWGLLALPRADPDDPVA